MWSALSGQRDAHNKQSRDDQPKRQHRRPAAPNALPRPNSSRSRTGRFNGPCVAGPQALRLPLGHTGVRVRDGGRRLYRLVQAGRTLTPESVGSKCPSQLLVVFDSGG